MSESQAIVLYHTLTSSFSQRVVMALNYLNLEFESRLVNIFAGEQLESWYLDLNPKGEVPTLQDGDITLTDSADILQYLSDTYDTRKSDEKLIPNPVTTLGKSVVEMNQLIGSVKVFVLTFGSSFFPEHCKHSKLSEEDSKHRKELIEKMLKSLEEKLVDAQAPYKESYSYKLTKFTNGKKMINEKTLLAEIENTGKVLEKIEHTHVQSTNKWLFSNSFTIADISLLVLLYRIEKLGLQHNYSMLPKLTNYFKKAQQEAFVAKSLF